MNPIPRLVEALALALALLVAAGPLLAADYYVNRWTDSAGGDCTGDPGDCSLRAAILLANANPGADVVHLMTGTFELTIPGANEDLGMTGDLDVSDALTILGRGPERTTIDANAIDRVFDVFAVNRKLTLRGLTVTGGSNVAAGIQSGGGIRVFVGSLRLESCVVRGNALVGNGTGTAIHSIASGPAATTEIVDSWITGNSGPMGALDLNNAHIERSTVSGNSSTAALAEVVGLGGTDNHILGSTFGGNTVIAGSPTIAAWDAVVEIDGCTLVAHDGPALAISNAGIGTLRNTLLAGWCAASGPLTSQGGNLESPGGTCHLGVNDLDFVPNPGVSTLASFGGPAPVYQLLAGSPALDADVAEPSCAAVDERGLSRPRDGDGTGGAVCDIGAVELAGPGEIFVDGFECGFLTAWSNAVT